MHPKCELDESTLLDYLLDEAPAGLRMELERSPACRAAAADLAQRLSLVYRYACPDEQMLVAHGERRIADSSLALMLSTHVAACSHCREELALLRAIDELTLAPQPTLLRRVIAAAYQPPLAQALRGDMLQYQAGQLGVQLRIRRELDQPGRWTVRGRLRGAPAADSLQAVRVQRSDWPEPAAGDVEAGGAFRIKNLQAGSYRLAIDTAEQTVEIADLVVGSL